MAELREESEHVWSHKARTALFFAAMPFNEVLGGELPELNAFLPLAFIGLSQLVYLGPLWFLVRARERHVIAKGVAIAIAVTALLNAGCWGTLRVVA